MHTTPIQMPVVGARGADEDHQDNKVAQLYGGYCPARFSVRRRRRAGLVVSQWNTTSGWPYRAMQFNASVKDTTKEAPCRKTRSICDSADRRAANTVILGNVAIHTCAIARRSSPWCCRGHSHSASARPVDEPMYGVYTYHQDGAPDETWTLWPTCVLKRMRAAHVEHRLPDLGPDSDMPGYGGDARKVNGLWTWQVHQGQGHEVPRRQQDARELLLFMGPGHACRHRDDSHRRRHAG